LIYVICANPALDRLLILKRLSLDEVNRTTFSSTSAGGKGVNVARAIGNVGGEAQLFLFAGGPTGQWLSDDLRDKGITSHTFHIPRATRITTVLHEENPSRHTVINESGPPVPLAVTGRFLDKIERTVRRDDYLVLSGSLPPGLPIDFYRRLLVLSRRQGVHCILDSSGIPFAQAFLFRPFMVKPNVKEAEEALGYRISSREGKIQAVRDFLAQGVANVVLSDGSRGVLVGGEGGWWEVTFHGRTEGGCFGIGSGDTLVGVLVEALSRGVSWPAALRWSTSCALANTFTTGSGVFDPALAGLLSRDVRIERLARDEGSVRHGHYC